MPCKLPAYCYVFVVSANASIVGIDLILNLFVTKQCIISFLNSDLFLKEINLQGDSGRLAFLKNTYFQRNNKVQPLSGKNR